MQHILADVHYRMNMLLPVNRLPPELIIATFKCIVDELDAYRVICLPARYDTQSDIRPLLALTHVCRHWRDVAIAFPKFWSSILVNSLDLVETFLTRSAPLPASVYVSKSLRAEGRYPDTYRAMIARHRHRIARLEIEAAAFVNVVGPLLSIGLPSLDCLTISSYEDNLAPDDYVPGMDGQGDGKDGLAVEDRLCLPDSMASSLKALTVLPIVDFLPWGDFKTLTHLYLTFNPTYAKFDVHDIIAVLVRMPALCHLHLALIIFPRVRRRPPLKPNSVPLDCLPSLTFTSCVFRYVTDLLRILVLPQDILVRMQDMNCPREAVPLPRLDVWKTVTSLEIASLGPRRLQLIAEGTSRSGLWLQLEVDDMPSASEPWLRDFFTTTELSSVTTLRVCLGPGINGIWEAMLRNLPNLLVLHVHLRSSYCARIEPLALLLSQDAPASCPSLHTLSIARGMSATDALHLPFIALLGRMLAARAQAGRRLRRLELEPFPSGYLTIDDMDEAADEYQTLRQHVDEYHFRYPDQLGDPFKMHDMWRNREAEKYWEVAPNDKPEYVLPW